MGKSFELFKFPTGLHSWRATEVQEYESEIKRISSSICRLCYYDASLQLLGLKGQE